ncbi:MAG: stage II sporulation protein D [Peptococcaceae bacterium]
MQRYFWGGMFLLVVIIIIIPLLTLLFVTRDYEVEIGDMDKTINVYNYQTKQLMQMGFEDYIAGVVAAEMPASFDIEALKAQAVAARTYAYKRVIEPDPTIKKYHPQAHVVTDSNVCQAWTSDAELKEKWGLWDYKKYKQKIIKAVQETKGEVLVYDGDLIDPVYHASCGGTRTENSGDVWQYNFPYLQSVPCSGHEDPHSQEQKTIDLKSIDVALGSSLQAVPAAKLQGNSNQYINVREKTETGRIKTINIGGKTYPGTEVRTKLGLKSTLFTWKINTAGITFTTRGYGHGVGMCQYGADDFAKKGKTYEQILKHYYQGVEISRIKY